MVIGILKAAVRRTPGSASLSRAIPVLGEGEVERKHVVAFLLGLAFTTYYVSPLYTAVVTAFKTQTGFLRTSPMSPPGEHFTIETWFMAWETLAGGLFNSLVMTLPAMFFSAVLGSLAAFGLTMVDWRGQLAVFVGILLALFTPRQAVIVPLAQFWRDVDLAELLIVELLSLSGRYITLLELSLTHTIYGIAICTVLFRGYYLTIDRDLIEAARVDGASIPTIYRRIVLPLSYPMFFVVFIFQFTQIYNEFFVALILVGGTNAEVGAPVTLALQEINSGREALFNVEMAGALIVAIPTLIIYVLFGEEFAKGVRY